MLSALSQGGDLLHNMVARQLITLHRKSIEDREGIVTIKDEPKTPLLSWLIAPYTSPFKEFLPTLEMWKNSGGSFAPYSSNIAHAQIADLELALNLYCLNHSNIKIIHSAATLLPPPQGHSGYIPRFYCSNMKTGGYQPDFPIDLICIAEGANSPNRVLIGGHLSVDPEEKWWYGNYTGHSSKLGGFQNFHITSKGNSVTLGIEQKEHSLVNIGVYFRGNIGADVINS